MTDPGNEYRRRADAFERLICDTPPDRWTSPSPCDGWSALDIVSHVVAFTARVLHEHAGIEPSGDADFQGPLDAFRSARAAVQQVLDDPSTPTEVASYIQWSVSFELPQHGWDLAKATGQDATIAPEDVEILWGPGDPEQFEKAFGWQREQGWYGPAIAVPEDAPIHDKVLGLLGRDPHWQSP